MSTIIDGIDYGPLSPLIGQWIGTRGVDKALQPEPEGMEQTPFIDEIDFKIAGAANNADSQDLVALRYHHVVRKQENGLIFHDQIGHWIYEPATGLIMLSLTIPRAVCVLAGGTLTVGDNETLMEVRAESGSDSFGVVQSPFMLEKAKTKAFEMTFSFNAETINYQETTYLSIYGQDYDHVDKSQLRRVSYDLD